MKKRLSRIIAAAGIMAILCIMLTACIGPIGGNQKPVADFIMQVEALTVIFYGSSSFDPDGKIISWNWYFGDGGESGGTTVTHTYIASGTYPVLLRVRDNNGADDEITRDVTVVAPATYPVASFSSRPPRPRIGSEVRFNGKSSYDPDGWIAWGSWNFGDESIVEGSWTTWIGGAEFSAMREVTHPYTQTGSYTIILTIVDNDGNAATALDTIVIREL